MPDHIDAPWPQRQASEELEALFAGNAVGMAMGRDTRVLQANDEFLRIVGRTRGVLDGGLDWTHITPDDHLERDAAALGEIDRRGAAVILKDFVHPDGTRVPVLGSVTAIESVPYRWIAMVVDLSSHRQLAHLAEADAAIVSTLLEDAPIGFAFISPDLRFVRVNRELAAMNGYSVAEHEGTEVFDLVPGIRATAEPLLREVLATGEPLRDVEIVGTTAAEPDIEHTWLESFFPVRAPQGPTVGVAAIARDVTDLRAVQRKLDETLARQRTALETLQRSLMPDVGGPFGIPGLETAARYLSAAEEVRLGGDWFDLATAPDGAVVLSVGDVVGHGLEAVGLMAHVSAAVRAYVAEGHTPAMCLRLLNRMLCAPTGRHGLVTAIVMRLNPATGTVEYANAGHPDPLLYHPDGTVRQLISPGDPLLGVVPDATYHEASTEVGAGTALLLYSDGLVERPGESIDDGIARLARALGAARRAGHTGESLLDRLIDHCVPGPHRRDDICVLTASYSAP